MLKYTGEVWIRGRKVVFLREILRAMAGRFNLRFRSDCLFSEIFEGGGYDNSLLINSIHSIYTAADSSVAAFVVPTCEGASSLNQSYKINIFYDDEKGNQFYRQGFLREPLLRNPLLAGGGGAVPKCTGGNYSES